MTARTPLTPTDFAHLCHTSKHTLFHYYDIGLFSPAYTDHNGYRYYHILPYDSFLTITQLRLIGMPLSEIKNYMSERSPKRMIEMYRQQEQALNCSEKCFLEKQNKGYLLCSEIILQTDDYTMTNAIGDLIYSANTKISSNTLGIICNLNDVINSNNYPCRFYVYMHSSYETLGESCKNLVTHAKQNYILLDNLIYAETIIGDWAVHSPSDYIIKISVKVNEIR